jgi:hypothetical protein
MLFHSGVPATASKYSTWELYKPQTNCTLWTVRAHQVEEHELPLQNPSSRVTKAVQPDPLPRADAAIKLPR